MQRLFISQKRSIRTIKHVSRDVSCKSLFTELNILTLPCIYIINCALFKRKHPQKYTTISDISPYDTRNKSNVVIKKHHSEFYKKNPYYQTHTIYDFLPTSLKNVKSDEKFKSILKLVLIQKCYYTVKEFFDINTKISEDDIKNVI
jgi:hypothetical protein